MDPFENKSWIAILTDFLFLVGFGLCCLASIDAAYRNRKNPQKDEGKLKISLRDKILIIGGGVLMASSYTIINSGGV